MANQDNKSFVDVMVDAQKKVVDTVVENTGKFANGNPMVSETMQKGADWYKNWLEGQKTLYTKSTGNLGNMSGNIEQQMNQMNEYYQNWFNNQMNQTKQIWDMNMAYFRNAPGTANGTADSNPFAAWQNMMNNWNSWMSNMNAGSQWMNMMQQWNNMFGMDNFRKATDNWTGLFNQYQEIMNSNWTKFREEMQNGTAQDASKNMVNATESFSKFYEMWMPMWKSIQDKTFNTEIYKQWMNPAMYKDLMDKYLGFMPENSRTYMQQFTNMAQEQMKQMSGAAMQQFQQMRNMMGSMPGMDSSGMFGNMLNGYNQFYNMMTEAAAPFTRMMTPNQHTRTMAEWQDIANRIAIYNIKNAELQYMMYTQGTKVMDKLAENVMQKVQSGQEINSIMALFQEWMNLSDKTFVSLFESDEYSQLMAEVSAMQLRLRKDMEMQMEKFMTGIPVATRSEMDELYKTIYDLKKQIRQMEKMMELDSEEAVEEPKATRRTTKK